MDGNSHTEQEGGVMSLFRLMDATFLVYKQLSRYNNELKFKLH